MRLSESVTRLVLIVCTLDAATSFAASIPLDASFNMKIRDVEVLNMHSRNIKAREPRPAANLAAATSNIEKRGGKMDAIVEIGKMIGDVISQIKGAIAADKQHRSDWTQQLVSQMYAKDSSRNYIVCHTKHSYKFDGVKGKDWDHRHEELPMGLLGKTTGFEIYWLHGGTFQRQGDGGFLNWAYIGNFVASSNGKNLTFK